MKKRSLDLSSTIFALATGRPPSAIAVVRLSGPRALEIAKTLAGKAIDTRGMYRVDLKDPQGEYIDDALLLSFPAPQSFTGEDVVEFQIHGSIPIVQKLEQTLGDLGAMGAEPGEFSYRALMHGKIDPNKIEQMGDLYLARDLSDLKAIYLRQDVAASLKIEKLRLYAIQLQAILDTSIDFSEEHAQVERAAIEPLSRLIDECSWMLSRYSGFREQRIYPRLVLAGLPNAGKSSLFNSLLSRYRAIVHAEAGTTRDVIEEDLFLGGRSWKVVDTAGLREGKSEAESQGIALAETYLKGAHFWLLVIDGAIGMTAEDQALLDKFSSVPHLVVWNKSDQRIVEAPATAVQVSATTGLGMEALRRVLEQKTLEAVPTVEGYLPTASQSVRLKQVLKNAEEIRKGLDLGLAPEVLAEHSRQILLQLEDLVGVVDTDAVLDRIFNDFCIGK